MAINWKYESAVDQVRRFWQGIRERHYHEGLMALPDARCPYPASSFAGLHWQRGHADRQGATHGNDPQREN